LHAEDLEEDRRLGPLEAARVCDFLSMHAYPMYLSWARSAADERVPAFLGLVTGFLGGREVLLEEFGAPAAASIPSASPVPVLEEERAALFTCKALQCIHESGLLGGMLWCFADYDASLWREPPLDRAAHERHFGIWRSDHSAKPCLSRLTRFAAQSPNKLTPHPDWIDMDRDVFYRDPAASLRHLYKRYCEVYGCEEAAC